MPRRGVEMRGVRGEMRGKKADGGMGDVTCSKQASLAETKKQSFRFGILKVNKLQSSFYKAIGEDDEDVYFPPNSDKIATFNGQKKSFGLQKLIPMTHLIEGRVLTDAFNKSVTQDIRQTYADFTKEKMKKRLSLPLPEDDEFKKELLSGEYTKGMRPLS